MSATTLSPGSQSPHPPVRLVRSHEGCSRAPDNSNRMLLDPKRPVTRSLSGRIKYSLDSALLCKNLLSPRFARRERPDCSPETSSASDDELKLHNEDEIDILAFARSVDARSLNSDCILVPKGKYLGRITLKRLRNKSRTQEVAGIITQDNDSLLKDDSKSEWKINKENPSEWLSNSGRNIEIPNTSFQELTETELNILQKLAVVYLQNLNFGCSIIIPKEINSQKSDRRWSFKQGHHPEKKDKRDSSSSYIFPIFHMPLNRVLTNEAYSLASQRKSSLSDSNIVSADPSPIAPRKSINSDNNASLNSFTDLLLQPIADKRKYSLVSAKHPSPNLSSSSLQSHVRSTSSLVEALVDNVEQPSSLLEECGVTYVPVIVSTCCQYLLDRGLQTVGLFRVVGSKKRLKQLKEEIDSGFSFEQSSQDFTVHDVAALLKEFFRLLPEPLLTIELYQPFVASTKLSSKERQLKALRFLVTLLPRANRDTLAVLLHFLSVVSLHSSDYTVNGEEIPGNKMDSANLALVFGPNLLHPTRRKSQSEFEVDSQQCVEDHASVVEVIKNMIEFNQQLFIVEGPLLSEILRIIVETSPDLVDLIIQQRILRKIGESKPALQMDSLSVPPRSISLSLPSTPGSQSSTETLGSPQKKGKHIEPLREKSDTVGNIIQPNLSPRSNCSTRKSISEARAAFFSSKPFKPSETEEESSTRTKSESSLPSPTNEHREIDRTHSSKATLPDCSTTNSSKASTILPTMSPPTYTRRRKTKEILS